MLNFVQQLSVLNYKDITFLLDDKKVHNRLQAIIHATSSIKKIHSTHPLAMYPTHIMEHAKWQGYQFHHITCSHNTQADDLIKMARIYLQYVCISWNILGTTHVSTSWIWSFVIIHIKVERKQKINFFNHTNSRITLGIWYLMYDIN